MTRLGSPVLSSQSFWGFPGPFRSKNPAGMTRLGFPGLSSRSVSGFSRPFSAKKTRNGPGKPRLVMPVRFGAFWPKRAKKPETDWEDKPGKPRFVIPVCFGVFWPKRAKNPKRTGMTSQGRPGLSQSVSGFSGRKAPTKTRNGQAWEAQACHPSPF